MTRQELNKEWLQVYTEWKEVYKELEEAAKHWQFIDSRRQRVLQQLLEIEEDKIKLELGELENG